MRYVQKSMFKYIYLSIKMIPYIYIPPYPLQFTVKHNNNRIIGDPGLLSKRINLTPFTKNDFILNEFTRKHTKLLDTRTLICK